MQTSTEYFVDVLHLYFGHALKRNDEMTSLQNKHRSERYQQISHIYLQITEKKHTKPNLLN